MGTAVIETHANYSPFRNAIELWVTDKRPDGGRGLATSLVFELVEPNTHYGEPTLRLDHDEARGLMDELWRAGVRPTEVGSPGQLAAITRHLEDMRMLAFKSLDLGVLPVVQVRP